MQRFEISLLVGTPEAARGDQLVKDIAQEVRSDPLVRDMQDIMGSHTPSESLPSSEKPAAPGGLLHTY